MKALHEGALATLFIVRKTPQVPHSAQQVACHSVNNSKGKGKSIPPQKTRRDSSPYSAGTLRPESEMERTPDVPASIRDEALFDCTKPS